ncbi:MAG: diguanylate cyclase [Clostridiales bacterium]|nr:diguanylate cyclase [Clostridiales bacterium]
MEKLKELIHNNESFLLKRILSYAKLHDYVKFTSTLEEAWIASISGLSESIIQCISIKKQVPEINVHEDFIHDPISYFGRVEAQLHRQRGITLEMFLGLMKYYRQSYLDLIMESVSEQESQRLYVLWVNRFFDHNEIAFCKEWNEQSKDNLLSELQKTNRELSNEKNKYLTIFESIPTPVILLDAENYCKNMNYAAQQLLQENKCSPGYIYYNNIQHLQKVNDILPWIIEEFNAFYQSTELEATVEKDFESPSHGKRNLTIKFHRMLDVSGKFTGTVIIFTDETVSKQIEEQLRYISFRDIMTGLYNRTYFEQEVIRLSTGKFNPVGIISCDVDGLKLVNDHLGHQAGDELIKISGQILKSCFTESDTVCRIGGDEFMVVLPYSDDAAVQKACKRFRDKLTEHNTLTMKMPISISIGWASDNLFSSKDIFRIIKEADSRMYLEKEDHHAKYISMFLRCLNQYGQDLF